MAIFAACFCRNEHKEESIDVHQKQLKQSFQSKRGIERLNESQILSARRKRLRELKINTIVRDFFVYSCVLIFISLITYFNRTEHSFYEVQHLRRYFLNQRQINNDYTKVTHRS